MRSNICTWMRASIRCVAVVTIDADPAERGLEGEDHEHHAEGDQQRLGAVVDQHRSMMTIM